MRETPKALAAFHEYCLLGPARSLRKLAESKQEYSKSVSLLMRWSTDHNWQERVKVYDAERAEEKRHKQEEELERMNAEHALLGRTQALRAVKQIEKLIEAQKFGSQASVQLLKVGTDLERVARGAVTERTEQNGNMNVNLNRNALLAQLSDDELDKVDDLLAKAEERLRGSSSA